MGEFYLYLNSKDSLQVRKNSEFLFQLPKEYTLDGKWSCAITEITISGEFPKENKRLYLVSDFVNESCVRSSLESVLRNIEIHESSNQSQYIEFINPVYVPVTINNLNLFRIIWKDEDLHQVQLSTNEFHCVLHFKKIWAP